MKRNTVYVFGDVMLDMWQHVVPTKVSPEAPVLVVRLKGFTYSPGGAGNAAVNCAHLGAETHLIGLYGHGIGNDGGSRELLEALKANNVRTDYMVPSPYLPTICKQRLVDELGRHLIRVDIESDISCLDAHDLAGLRQSLDCARRDATLLVSDYGKGTCQPGLLLPSLFTFSVINGKPEKLEQYTYATVLVLNKHEAQEAVKRRAHAKSVIYSARDLAAVLASYTLAKHIIVTDGANGLYWSTEWGGVRHFPAPKVDVADVAGAGDSICATIAVAGTVNEIVLEQAVKNAASVVSQRGTSVPIL